MNEKLDMLSDQINKHFEGKKESITKRDDIAFLGYLSAYLSTIEIYLLGEHNHETDDIQRDEDWMLRSNATMLKAYLDGYKRRMKTTAFGTKTSKEREAEYKGQTILAREKAIASINANDKIHKVEKYIRKELCERRDYSASKMCEVILEYINSIK